MSEQEAVGRVSVASPDNPSFSAAHNTPNPLFLQEPAPDQIERENLMSFSYPFTPFCSSGHVVPVVDSSTFLLIG